MLRGQLLIVHCTVKYDVYLRRIAKILMPRNELTASEDFKHVRP